MTITRSSLLALACLGGLAGAQTMSLGEMQSRREELRRRYIAATSPAEKKAIHAEFRALDVDLDVRRALALDAAGDAEEALEVLRRRVRETNFESAKARYFLAKEYLSLADRGGPEAAGYRRLALLHLRGAADLPDDRWATEARRRLALEASRTPTLEQHTAGGSFPWGYCAVTALRMVLRHEGLADPGADSIALTPTAASGRRAYTPGDGSAGAILAERARELGLTGATFRTDGDLAAIRRALDAGRPVPVGGIGPFDATRADGTPWSATYNGSGHWMVVVGHETYARPGGSTGHRYQVNDPDTGERMTVDESDFNEFFSPGGPGNIWLIEY